MFLCPALDLPLLMNRCTIWHYRTMNADAWIRKQFFNKRLMLTCFFPLDYFLLNFSDFLKNFFGLVKWRQIDSQIKVSSFTFPLSSQVCGCSSDYTGKRGSTTKGICISLQAPLETQRTPSSPINAQCLMKMW